MIKEIIFDLGGVYFTDGTRKILEEFYKMINKPRGIIDEVFKTSAMEEGSEYRKGKLTKEEFWRKAQEKLGISEKESERLRLLWNDSYKPVEGMKELVQRLRGTYRVIAFSGNIKDRVEYLHSKYGLLDDFDDYIFSYEEGLNKFDDAFYDLPLKYVKHKPQECLYIDNSKSNLEHGKKRGFKTIHFTDLSGLERELGNFGVRV